MASASFLWANNAASTLAAPISSTSTSVTVATGQGALFPSPSAGQQFALTFNDAATGLLTEIVYVSARSADTMTIARAQEGTIAQSWLAGDLCANLITAGQMQSFVQNITYQPSRTVTASGLFSISAASDFYIWLARTTSLADSAADLPSDASPGQQFWIGDLIGNFQAYPVTITPPSGFNISGLPENQPVILGVNRQVAIFIYTGNNTYAVKL